MLCILVAMLLETVVVVVLGSTIAMRVVVGPKCVEVQKRGLG